MKDLEIIKETMSSIEIAELTGKLHKDVLEAIRVMEPAWEKVAGRKFPLSEYKDSTGRKLPMYELNKAECLYVATKFNDEARAKLVLRWEQLEVNNSHVLPRIQDLTQAKILAAEFNMKALNMNDASKIPLLKAINEPLGLPVPDYVDSKGILLSISQIIEGTGISAQKANKILSDHGVLVKRFRRTSKGREKPFWVIAEQFSNWGENKVHPQNQDEVQTKWYEGRKNEILGLIKSSREK